MRINAMRNEYNEVIIVLQTDDDKYSSHYQYDLGCWKKLSWDKNKQDFDYVYLDVDFSEELLIFDELTKGLD